MSCEHAEDIQCLVKIMARRRKAAGYDDLEVLFDDPSAKFSYAPEHKARWQMSAAAEAPATKPTASAPTSLRGRAALQNQDAEFYAKIQAQLGNINDRNLQTKDKLHSHSKQLERQKKLAEDVNSHTDAARLRVEKLDQKLSNKKKPSNSKLDINNLC